MPAVTETREPQMGLTFEKVWAAMTRSQEEFDRTMKESNEKWERSREESNEKWERSREAWERSREEWERSCEEFDRRMKESNEKWERSHEELKQSLRQSLEETDRIVKEAGKQVGKLGNRFGELAEHLVAPSIEEKFNALGFHFEEISADRRIKDDHGQVIAEFDILLENGESIVGVEVKAKPDKDDVTDHERRLEILRERKDKKNDKRRIYGAFGGAIMLQDVKTAALKAGLYVLVQSGDTMKIDVPEDFQPRVW
ncbi:MAG: hypothetical protein LBL51_02545 [Synergistaceae bacterium]|jgi:hypothetical protein|nr:hypothetical protein [Synergistaceae bacterium]